MTLNELLNDTGSLVDEFLYDDSLSDFNFEDVTDYSDDFDLDFDEY